MAIFISSCTAVKRVPNGRFLLSDATIYENEKLISDEDVTNQFYQKPNTKFGKFPYLLHLYNWANPNPDSTFQAKFKNDPKKLARMSKLLSAKQVEQLGKSFWYHGIHDFLKNMGEAPVIYDKNKTEKTLTRIKYHYFNKGFFNAKVRYTFDTIGVKKGRVNYYISSGKPYLIDSLKNKIFTPALDSLLKKTKTVSFLKSGNQYKTEDFENEKNRITTYFRNNGVFHFQPNNITFDIDTIKKRNKANVEMQISNYSYQENDSTKTAPFKIYKISNVKIFTDYSAADPDGKITDSTEYKNFNLYSKKKLKYKPFAITDAIFINKGAVYSDNRNTLTTRYLSNLKIFNYPSILYEIDKKDPKQESLIAKIYLSPRKKYSFGTSLDATHSNIQTFGIGFSPSISIRNVFNAAETLQFSGRANVGASKDFANPNNVFFNASEFGLDLKLNFPRMVIPFKTEKIIPKSMIPSTVIAAGYSKQKNIGLDKENFTGTINYNWNPKRNNTAKFELLNAQFVRNLNSKNYFNVYSNSYDALNAIAKNANYSVNESYFDTNKNLIIESGTNGFINDVLNTNGGNLSAKDFTSVKSISERKSRLTENDFILSSSFSFTKTTKKDLSDNNFYFIKGKIESAGSLLSLVANTAKLPQKSDGKYEIFNLEYAEYFKTEFEFVKHWDLSKEKVFAVRSFFGIAIPFGNSKSIPFSRSYYGGGSNDNRAWQPYSLGPGSTGGVNNFNEANMKLALSSEFRFKILGSVKGAFFVDAGNIWNVLDDTEEVKAKFTSLKDLETISVGSGFGIRYDLSFFVVRFDFGFKTYNPSDDSGKRWFRDYNFANSVLNFGINHPF